MCNDGNENARIGYQVATSLMMGQSQLYWSKFNALVVANSIIVLAATSMMGVKSHLLIASFFGAVLNVAALFMLYRSNAFHDHWKEKAAKFEENYFLGVVDTVSTSGNVKTWCNVTVKCWAMIILGLFAAGHLLLFIYVLSNFKRL